MKKTVLVISGYDGTNACGHLLDIRMLQRMGLHGFGIVSTWTAQNSRRVLAEQSVGIDLMKAQYRAISEEFQIDGVKVGLMKDPAQFEWMMETFGEKNLKILWDPVLISSSGHVFVEKENLEGLKKAVQACGFMVTPNVKEAAYLLEESEEHIAQNPTKALHSLGALFPTCAILLKGGHLKGPATDYLKVGTEMVSFEAPKISVQSDRGTGCMLSTCIAGHLAQGHSPKEAVQKAKDEVLMAMKTGYFLSEGRGFLNV